MCSCELYKIFVIQINLYFILVDFYVLISYLSCFMIVTFFSPARYFWETVNEYDIRLKRKFLLFCTGSDRVPVGGMKDMEFKITRMVGAKVFDM